ncbi:TetR/AcrR family transcriptional regulator [Nonomuraea lactucae]|uniref:TetR/AcrR family transcriptional regulator n=1 Tax=Nonomuraea lactucae TaxID=2249762 RepID=UPI000DE1EECA|nr:TetR/AcrR family transcriptional regulator [Nonomuraea lactucae]
MTSSTQSQRPPGRPRSRDADEAILAAALELLIESGAGATSIERVAQRAGVTRATVYRRFPDKTALLVEAIESMHTDHDPGALDWAGVEHMLADWAGYLSLPQGRRMLRRLYGAVDDHPELLEAYRNAHGRRRAAAVRATLERARADGLLPRDSDLDVVQQILNGAVLHHLGDYPDDESAAAVEAYLTAVLRQAGYRPSG